MKSTCHVCKGRGETYVDGAEDMMLCMECEGSGIAEVPCDGCCNDAEHVILDRSWHGVDPSRGIEKDVTVCPRCVYRELSTALKYEPTAYARPLKEVQAESCALGIGVVQAILDIEATRTERRWRPERQTVRDLIAVGPSIEMVSKRL